jgi:outer membrane protein assembly factor BamC
MLARIMVKMGAAENTAAAPRPAAPVPGARPTAASQPAPANAVLENAGAGPLVVNDGFDRAWRRVGLALDRVGFTVEDRDRSKGVFFVRYIDPDADKATSKNESWVDKMMFWRSPPKAGQPQYRIQVVDSGAGLSQVTVLNAQGAAESSSTGKRILSLLYDQLK